MHDSTCRTHRSLASYPYKYNVGTERCTGVSPDQAFFRDDKQLGGERGGVMDLTYNRQAASTLMNTMITYLVCRMYRFGSSFPKRKMKTNDQKTKYSCEANTKNHLKASKRHKKKYIKKEKATGDNAREWNPTIYRCTHPRLLR